MQGVIAFRPGDTVVYPKHGVGILEDIKTLSVGEQECKSFAITLKATGVKIFVPVEQASIMGLRHIESEHVIDKAIEILSNEDALSEIKKIKSWKDRKKKLDELFRSGRPEDLAIIVRFLYEKNKQKLLPNSERRIYDYAIKFLIHEVAEVKGISEVEADHLIAECLMK
ncbi:MAG TPA: CarD family transcriptional regulator [Spirochaetota bacterium]|nr:CarD family transcriptional regulator [Spirochaetota bacterium]HOM38336.1 CarD family transcriptional regulator [Spirochaetota bacterium]HPQ48446.1 CarD family transcriptional regulator [Spirochaetota bacterium]